MASRTATINLSSDHEEIVERLSKRLGKNKMRRKLFDAIYGRARAPRSLNQIMQDAGIRLADRQQAQNQIDALQKYQLIERHENQGSTRDRFVYQKDEQVRAIRDEIVKYADNPKLAKKMATKRRPAVNAMSTSTVRLVTRSALKKKAHLNVLYLTSDPVKSKPLRVDAEVRSVQEAIRGSKFRDSITIEYRPAPNLKTLLDGLNDLRPQIVHFSGHGNTQGVAMDNGKVADKLGKKAVDFVSFELLVKAVDATATRPRVIVLNSCESAAARNAFLKLGVIVVSMKTTVSDIAASAFAPPFYSAIASGQPVGAAFKQAAVVVELASLSEADTPQLHCPKGIDANRVILT